MLAFSLAAQAFSENGHKLVVQLAQYHLNDQARASLAELYGERWRRELIQLAGWAHEARPGPAWRTVLFDEENTGFEPSRNCPNNRCVVGAVLESRHVLSSEGFDAAQKRQAVQYLIHFITDLHVPVNAGRRSDEGGRTLMLDTSDLDEVSLHWVWNQGLFEPYEDEWFARLQRWRRDLTDIRVDNWSHPLAPVDWALESHRLAMEVAYPLAGRGEYDAIYRARAMPVLETQLMKAGVRLAAMLNETLGNSTSP